MKRLLITAAGFAIALYLVVAATLFVVQRSLIFPAPQHAPPVPGGFERVELRTADQLRLVAAYRPARDGRPTIVFFHGNGDSWSGAALATEALAEAGFGLMLPEYRGYAGNPGSPSEQGLYHDGRAAIEWLDGRGISPEELVIIGNSVGSGVAMQMALEYRPAALVLVSPFSSLPDVVAEKLPWLPTSLLLRDKFANKEKIGDFSGPVLLLHGTADDLIPAHHSRDLAKGHPQADLRILADAGHELAYRRAAQEIQRDWLNKVFAGDSPD